MFPRIGPFVRDVGKHRDEWRETAGGSPVTASSTTRPASAR
jgi:hypothetical protein